MAGRQSPRCSKTGFVGGGMRRALKIGEDQGRVGGVKRKEKRTEKMLYIGVVVLV